MHNLTESNPVGQGLWGPGSAFSDFEAFLESMKKRGVSFLEMLSMEMKGEGYYVARGLSFKEAEFQELECKLTPKQTRVYNDAVQVGGLFIKRRIQFSTQIRIQTQIRFRIQTQN